MLEITNNSIFVIKQKIESCFLQSISNPRSINSSGIFCSLLKTSIFEILDNSVFKNMNINLFYS